MKLLLRMFAVVCLAWAVQALGGSLVLGLWRSSDPLRFDTSAMEDAQEVLDRSGYPATKDSTPLSVRRRTLIVLV